MTAAINQAPAISWAHLSGHKPSAKTVGTSPAQKGDAHAAARGSSPWVRLSTPGHHILSTSTVEPTKPARGQPWTVDGPSEATETTTSRGPLHYPGMTKTRGPASQVMTVPPHSHDYHDHYSLHSPSDQTSVRKLQSLASGPK